MPDSISCLTPRPGGHWTRWHGAPRGHGEAHPRTAVCHDVLGADPCPSASLRPTFPVSSSRFAPPVTGAVGERGRGAVTRIIPEGVRKAHGGFDSLLPPSLFWPATCHDVHGKCPCRGPLSFCIVAPLSPFSLVQLGADLWKLDLELSCLGTFLRTQILSYNT